MHPSQAVNLEKLAAHKEAEKLKMRSQMYSLATTIMVKHSDLIFHGKRDGIKIITMFEVVSMSIELAEEMFKQIEAKEKEHAERQTGESSGTRSALQLP